MEYEWDKNLYSNMLSNQTLVDLYERNSERLGVFFNKHPDILGRLTGSTDMGNVSHVLPSIHPRYNIGAAEAPHSRDFNRSAGNYLHVFPITIVLVSECFTHRYSHL